MTFEQHCRQSKESFGESFKAVHKWLDEFMGKPGIGMKHRKYRHHDEGIKQVIVLFGKDAGKAARQHIIADLKEEGWIEGVHRFPKDEADYIEMDLY